LTKAVVLARGLGTRMRHQDDDGGGVAPQLDARQADAAERGAKAMMPIGAGGRPFLDYVLSALADAGYASACLVIAPDADAIRDYYERVAPPRRLRVAFAVQAQPRGTGDALLSAESFAGADDVLVLNGDNYYPVAALRALRTLSTGSAAATVLFDPDALVRESNIPAERIRAFALGLVDADGLLTDLIEKPDEAAWRSLGSSGSRALVSMNCWRLPPAIFDVCRTLQPSPRGELELPHAIHDAIIAGMRFHVVRSADGVLDLSRRADVTAVAARLRDVAVAP
jgi:glucose-1-phosphate thymidylyltransferase